MKIFPYACLLAASTCLATPAHASDVREIMGSVLAGVQEAGEIGAKCDSLLGEIEARKVALEGGTDAPAVGTTLVAFDEMNALVQAGYGEFQLYEQVMGDAERRQAGAECLVRLGTISARIGLSRPIYDRLAAIDASGEDAQTQYYLGKLVAGYERSGVALPDEQRARIQAIQEELAQISADLSRNIAEDQRSITATREELAGLPDDFFDSHPANEDGLITLTTAYPDYQPVMSYARSDALRRRFSEVYNQRAWPQNDLLLTRMFTLRQELATILGRPNYASLILEDKMLQTPARVEQLIADMAAIARPVAARDYAQNLAVLQEIDPAADHISYWQTGFLSPLAQDRYFGYDPQEARQYFTYENVRDGVLRLTEDLFQVDIRPWDTPVWHDDVEAYEMVDGDTVIGRFYFDNHPRPGKYTHANMIPIYPGVVGGEAPVGALVQNLPSGNSLMEHRDVETLLHEFGHMLHGMFGGRQRWFGQSGITTEWDFVEAPSQMLENWVYDYDTLATFAVDAQGNTIPRELVQRMNAARNFNRGIGDMVQLGYSNVSLQFHQQPVPEDLGAATRGWINEYAVVPSPDYVQMQAAFNHLDGYSAIYYTYRWSKVIADDLFTRFAAEGMRNPATAMDYRRMVLEAGGTRPAADLVHDFLGRDISLDAYREEMESGGE